VGVAHFVVCNLKEAVPLELWLRLGLVL
jgi:hypothetical protein